MNERQLLIPCSEIDDLDICRYIAHQGTAITRFEGGALVLRNHGSEAAKSLKREMIGAIGTTPDTLGVDHLKIGFIAHEDCSQQDPNESQERKLVIARDSLVQFFGGVYELDFDDSIMIDKFGEARPLFVRQNSATEKV